MNWLSVLFVLALAFVGVFLEAWLDLFRDLLGAQVNLLPALIVCTSLTSGILATALLSVLGGLWFDSLSCNPLGVSILPLFLVGFLIYHNRELLLRQNSFAHMVLGMTASAVCPMMTVFLLLNLGSAPLLGWESLWQLGVMTAGGALLTPFLFRLMVRIDHTFNYQPVSQSSFRADREIKRGRGGS